MLVNTSSAVEYKTVTDYNICLIESNLENINNFLEKLRQILDGKEINSINLISKNEIIEISEKILELKISILDDPPLPTFILKILGFILSIIFSLIGTIIGIVFVIEALSVIIQLTSKKFFKKKVFKIAPIHHHFEQKGWKEFTIVMRFWIIGAIGAAFGTILGLINIL